MSRLSITRRVRIAVLAMYLGLILPWAMVALTVLVAYLNAGAVLTAATGVVAVGTHSLERRFATSLVTRTAPTFLRVVTLPLAEFFWVVRFSILRGTPFNAFVYAFIGCLALGWALNLLWGTLL